MSDIHHEMQQLRDEQNAVFAQNGQQEQRNEENKEKTRKAVSDLLKKICNEFVHGDEKLQVIDEGQELSPGYVILDSAVPSYRALSFAVSGECQANHVEILVSDQKWRQVNNFVGNWGNWTDQETVYSGNFDEIAIRKKVEAVFLDWYQTVLSRRAAVRKDT